MGPMVEALIAIPVVAAAGVGSVGLTMRSRLRRSLRLFPGRRVEVPWGWRWSLRRAPVLHRRLQRACQIVLAATGGGTAHPPRGRRRRGRHRGDQDASILHTTGRVLLEQAAHIDHRLVAADRGGPAWRRLYLPALTSEVSGLEASCLRLAQLSRAFDDHLDSITSGGDAPTQRADLLMDAMEAAMGDMRREQQVAEQ